MINLSNTIELKIVNSETETGKRINFIVTEFEGKKIKGITENDKLISITIE